VGASFEYDCESSGFINDWGFFSLLLDVHNNFVRNGFGGEAPLAEISSPTFKPVALHFLTECK
jgi:hypothetical protein